MPDISNMATSSVRFCSNSKFSGKNTEAETAVDPHYFQVYSRWTRITEDLVPSESSLPQSRMTPSRAACATTSVRLIASSLSMSEPT